MSFNVEVFQNRHLAAGSSRVDAVVTVTSPTMSAEAIAATELMVGFIVDTSGSMRGERIAAMKGALARALAILDPTTLFFVVAFDGAARLVAEPTRATPAAIRGARTAIDALAADGGTAMSNGLAMAREVFSRAPNAIRQAVFLTDGKNEGESHQAVTQELARCAGIFQCDCWGVGTDWQVGEVQRISDALMGKASIIPDPNAMAQAFGQAMRKASGKAFKNVRIRLWQPQGAILAFLKQVNPTIEDLTTKGAVVTPQITEFGTGSWGAGESRDFHVAIDVRVGNPGDEMRAGKLSLAYETHESGAWKSQEDKPADGAILASWTTDATLSSRIDTAVAHYTGQDELAKVIVEGLAAREAGQETKATELLGRAVAIAHASQNGEMTQRLSRVVDVVDPRLGTVRLRRDIGKAAEMELQLESRTTKRVSRGAAATATSVSAPNGGTKG